MIPSLFFAIYLQKINLPLLEEAEYRIRKRVLYLKKQLLEDHSSFREFSYV